MFTNLQNLARYYRDVLTALAENSGRALRNLNVGRRYGLVADLTFFPISLPALFEQPEIKLDRIVPDPETDDSIFESEPDPSTGPADDVKEFQNAETDAKLSESHALIRIWRKQQQDIFNRETLLGFGILRAVVSAKSQAIGPLICYRVRPVYHPETRNYVIEKIVETPFPNLTLLAQIMSEDELSDIREQLHNLVLEEDFDEAHFRKLVMAISGVCQSLRNLKYFEGPLQTLSKLNSIDARNLPVLMHCAVLLNIPRGNAYLLDDLEKLAAEGNDETLKTTAVGPILEVPSDHEGDEGVAERVPNPNEELLFPKESNREQRRVASLAPNSRILVVHGPPGTGKSQTICNLVSHLVACGKTVLVTSQKDKALEVVRDNLPNIDYLAMALLRTDKESQKALLQALEYYQTAVGQVDFGQLDKGKAYLREKLSANSRKIVALENRFSELRRLEHDHFADFKRMSALRTANKLDPRDQPNSGDSNHTGRCLQEYAGCYQQLISQAPSTAHWLIGFPSNRPSAKINALLSSALKLQQVLEQTTGPLKDVDASAFAREINAIGINFKACDSVFHSWTEWLRSSAIAWIRGRSAASLENIPGCEREELQKLAHRYPNDVLKAWHSEVSQLHASIESIEKTTIPDRYVGRALDQGQAALLRDAVASLAQVESSLLKWFLAPSVRDSKKWLRSANFPKVRWSQRTQHIAELSTLANHWQLRNAVHVHCEKLHEAGVLAATPSLDASTFTLRCSGREASHRLELALASPPIGSNNTAGLFSLLFSRLENLEKTENIEQELTIIEHAGRLTDAQSQIAGWFASNDNDDLPSEFVEVRCAAQSWDRARIRLALEALSRYAMILKLAQQLSGLEQNQLASYSHTLESLRDEIRNQHECPKWLTRAGEAVEAHRLFALARSVNADNLDDTNTVCDSIRKIAQESKNAVIDLLRVQRRLQLLNASQSRLTAFTILKAKKLLTRKRKTIALEKIKTDINFKQLLTIFPCWVLSIDDVARIFPLEAGLFDYLIVDEASQCNQATALHLSYRAKQMVVVGDEKQLPNASVQWLRASTIQQLLTRHHLAEHPKSEFLSVHESLLGLALGSCDNEAFLNEHFRCDPKIIEWSNREFYGGTLRILTPLRSLRFDKPIEVHCLPAAREDIERKINEHEAESVIHEVGRILDDPKLAGLTIGVISPFQPQADYIHARLQLRFASRWSECEKRGLTASTADGFQGDERDIVLYSLRHSLGSRPGSITGIEANQGARRLNVAFTRARRKMVLFTSMPIANFPGRYIRSFLDHAQTVEAMPPGPFFGHAVPDTYDSDFERDVCERLRNNGLEVVTQFPVAGYRIDLIVRDKAGRRIGIECDGAFHYDELGQLREEDYEREEILERAGWAIHRIPSRRFYFDPDREITLAMTVLSTQKTDAEVSILEEEDLSRDGKAVAVGEPVTVAASETVSPLSIIPSAINAAQVLASVLPDGREILLTKSGEPSFDNPRVWIELARWAKETGQWTMANRTFLWGVGDKIRRRGEIDESDRSRAKLLWDDAVNQGFRPQTVQ